MSATVGTYGWGVLLSTGRASGVPSGTILAFHLEDAKVDDISMDKIKRLTGNAEYIINLHKNWTEVVLSECRVINNTIATLNSYKQYLMNWWNALDTTQLYFWLKKGSTYVDFYIAGTAYDYLPCLLQEKISTNLSAKEITFDIKLGKYGS